jgi:hypothetical protein
MEVIMNNRAVDKIKQVWEEQPLQVIAVASLAATAAAKLLNAATASRNSRAWSKEVDRRIMMRLK